MEKKKRTTKKPNKIKIVQPVAGQFGLSTNVDDIIKLEQKQMEEMVEMGYAEWVK